MTNSTQTHRGSESFQRVAGVTVYIGWLTLKNLVPVTCMDARDQRGHSKNTSHFFQDFLTPFPLCHTFDYPLKNYITLTQPPSDTPPDRAKTMKVNLLSVSVKSCGWGVLPDLMAMYTVGWSRIRDSRLSMSFGLISVVAFWNSLPAHLRHCQTVLTFKRHLKTHYFNG